MKGGTKMTDQKQTDQKEIIRKLLLLLEKAKEKLTTIDPKLSEPIAIIGMGCRFPGGANSPEEFWNLLIEGKDGVSQVPINRWDKDKFLDPDSDAPGKMVTANGGFLNCPIEDFDAEYFGISPREAENLDPQHRLLMEVTWEALENAGIASDQLVGTRTGVLIGMCTNDYKQKLLGAEKEDLNAYVATGNAFSTASGRISFGLGLNGMSEVIDTACSSSLVAIDQAVLNLCQGNIDMALVGGVNLILSPEASICFSKAGMLSPSGYCHTFDKSADGYIRSEGCGMVVLKRLSDAQKDDDSILAIIRATSVNQDGKSSGLTVPNGTAQIKLIEEALTKSKIGINDINVIEAHGTGTRLGDPIEVNSIAETYGKNRDEDNPLFIGSVKSNIGHLEGGAGVASLIKMILALQHEKLPANLHFKELNPEIDLNFSAKILDKSEPWFKGKKIRRAAINSFGFSGTNAHLILEEAPDREPSDPATGPYIFLLSAKTEIALAQQEKQFTDYLKIHKEVNKSDIAYTLAFGRKHFHYRKVITDGDIDEATQEKMQQWLAGEDKDWSINFQGQKRHRVSLPTYPFQRERFWADVHQVKQTHAQSEIHSHPLLGRHLDSVALSSIIFETIVTPVWPEFLADHIIYDNIVIAGGCYVSSILSAIGVFFPENTVIEQIEFIQPLILSDESQRRLQTLIYSEKNGICEFTILSSSKLSDTKKEDWKEHVNGNLRVLKHKPETKTYQIEQLHNQFETTYRGDKIRQEGELLGLKVKGHHHWIESVAVNNNNFLAKMRKPRGDEIADCYRLYPGFIDACIQTIMAIYIFQEKIDSVFIPISIDTVYLQNRHGIVEWVYGTSHQLEGNETFDLHLLNASGQEVGCLSGVRVYKAPKRTLEKILADEQGMESLFYQWKWQQSEAVDAISQNSSQLIWMFFGQAPNLPTFDKKRYELLGSFTERQYDYLAKIEKNRISLQIDIGVVLWHMEDLETGQAGIDGATQFIYDVLAALQMAIKLSEKTVIPCYVITRNVQQNTHSMNYPLRMLNGLMKTFHLEHPNIPICYIDFSGDISEADLNKLIELELSNYKPSETFISYNKTNRMVGRLLPAKIEVFSEDELRLDKSSSYLITGGLGDLGLLLAKWLVNYGAGEVVLTGRRELTVDLQKKITAIEDLGASVRYEPLDVSSGVAVRRLLEKIQQGTHPLKGVFHLAGILEDAAFTNQDSQLFEKVFLPKVEGSFNLHHYTQQLQINLDYFVLFSSSASTLGNPGQANYTSANSYMDALACYRNKNGLPALSIAWGPWSGIGMAMQLLPKMLQMGITPLSDTLSFQALRYALTNKYSEVMIANIKWSLYFKQQAHWPSWLGEIVAELSSQGEDFSGYLESLEVGERYAAIEQRALEIFMHVLGVKDANSVDREKGFSEMGMDSIMALTLRNQLQNIAGSKFHVPSTVAFDYHNLNSIINYLAMELNIDKSTEKNKPAANPLQHVSHDEDIAIIGMSCRFPNGANNPVKFWELLAQGYDGISRVPIDRWDAEVFYDPDRDAPGKMISPLSGFLKLDVSQFDADFFRINPKEAEMLDPQQRILLELAWEALENAGITPSLIKGTQTGVYMGMSTHDYSDMLSGTGSLSDINQYYGTGNAASALCGRISYFLGANGPCYAVDTACSTSLVALHNACQNLLTGEANLGIVGAVNLILSPKNNVYFTKAGMLSPDGHCKTFDAQADGYVRGEGSGVLIIKRLSEANRDNDNILAVIKGSGINQDGASFGLTVPNGQAQVALLNLVVERSGVKPEEVDYIETHGTGTSLGDPIEVRALGCVYGKNRKENRPLVLGAVKSNIGHLEAAAGMASLIKVIMALTYKKIPKNLHFKTLNGNIDAEFPVTYPNDLLIWQRQGHPRTAGISGFAFSGTNAHVILQEPPEKAPSDESKGPFIYLLSAKTKAALEEQELQFKDYLKNHQNVNKSDIAYTLALGREHFQYRKVITDSELDKATQEKIQQWLEVEDVDWADFYKNQKRQKVSLPTYPFQRKRYWASVLDTPQKVIKYNLVQDKTDDHVKKSLEDNELINLLYSAEIGAHIYIIRDFIREQLKIVLGYKDGEIINDEIGFFDLGVDSLMAVTLRNRLQKSLGDGFELRETAGFDYPNIKKLSDYINELITLSTEAQDPPSIDEVLEHFKQEIEKSKKEE